MDKKDLKNLFWRWRFPGGNDCHLAGVLLPRRISGEIGKALQEMEPLALLGTVILSVLFVCGEGLYDLVSDARAPGDDAACTSVLSIPLWDFLLRHYPVGHRRQPMQLYCMKKDGGSMSHSSIVLLTVAIAYKTVLVAVGVRILVFWFHPLRTLLGELFLAVSAGAVAECHRGVRAVSGHVFLRESSEAL